MNLIALSRPNRPFVGRWAAVIVLVFTITLSVASRVQAQEDSAFKILKAMSDYLVGQKVISAALDTDIEVITPELQKIQFASSGQLLLNRPEKLRVSRTGGYADVELLYDGSKFTIYDKYHKVLAQRDVSGSVDQLIDRLRSEAMIEAPGADLLLSNPYEALTMDVLDAKHIGRGVVDGVECEHLAFRYQDTDSQIWIEAGSRPVPRKYVITSKAVTGGPQYTLRIKDWKTDEQLSADAFTLKQADGVRKIEFKAQASPHFPASHSPMWCRSLAQQRQSCRAR
jgi:hypothetical protein